MIDYDRGIQLVRCRKKSYRKQIVVTYFGEYKTICKHNCIMSQNNIIITIIIMTPSVFCF